MRQRDDSRSEPPHRACRVRTMDEEKAVAIAVVRRRIARVLANDDDDHRLVEDLQVACASI